MGCFSIPLQIDVKDMSQNFNLLIEFLDNMMGTVLLDEGLGVIHGNSKEEEIFHALRNSASADWDEGPRFNQLLKDAGE
ncbi:MAG: hypothetical protein LJE96_05665 [Deltaproteobacteria bacterium]|jgi:phosphotransferase system IIB component|nr:hypothetical protein [Deltaproteobacteria bacterium]